MSKLKNASVRTKSSGSISFSSGQLKIQILVAERMICVAYLSMSTVTWSNSMALSVSIFSDESQSVCTSGITESHSVACMACSLAPSSSFYLHFVAFESWIVWQVVALS